jgi:signal transduction histidine kinase
VTGLLPRTLFARLALILCLGLAAAQALSFWLTMTERNQAQVNLMMGYIEREVATSVALLDRLPASERAAWLPRLARRSYEFVLGPGQDVSGAAPDAALSARVNAAIGDGLGRDYMLRANAVPGQRERFQVHLRLSDGAPLTIDVRPMPSPPMAQWLTPLLLLQLAVLGGCCWLAVRLATAPLHQLAAAADALGPDLKARRLPEDGPSEVARAARAFNAMQDRIAAYTAERIQILAAISHDLQTPITRMRLRVDTLEDAPQQDKLQQDLREMQSLVKEGVAYARTLNGVAEAPTRIDPDALFDSLVCDYTDAGQDVVLRGSVGAPLVTRPQALRRVVANLVDNALKFGGAAEIELARAADGGVTVAVLDRGPGIPEESLEAVFQPYVRLETSRNRHTGGTGLGLAIARQLAQAMNASLTLHQRPGGGLEARLRMSS